MARPATAGQAGVLAPLIRNSIAAVGLVLVMVAAFTLMGARATDDDGQAAPAPDEPAGDAVDIDDTDDPGGKLVAPPIEPPAPAPEPGGDDNNGDDTDDTDDTDDDDSQRIPPSEISIQVLDGYRADGGNAAQAVADELAELGYRIAAQNPAIAYEITTVLWSEGFEAEARQVAEDIGAPEVREQPGNLSAQVSVHVVVGADRG